MLTLTRLLLQDATNLPTTIIELILQMDDGKARKQQRKARIQKNEIFCYGGFVVWGCGLVGAVLNQSLFFSLVAVCSALAVFELDRRTWSLPLEMETTLRARVTRACTRNSSSAKTSP
jgi:hypothetical protein